MQKYHLTLKIITIGVLCLMFVIGLGIISGIVKEREGYHRQVMDEIKSAHTGDQTVITPFLLVQSDAGYSMIFADKSEFATTASVQDDQYQRGIYHAISYQATLNSQQSFDLTHINDLPTIENPKGESQEGVAKPAPKNPPSKVAKKVSLIIATSDMRGISSVSVNVGGQTLPAKLVNNTLSFKHLAVDVSHLLAEKATTVTINSDIPVAGIDSFNIVPLGEQFSATLSSNWQEPNFSGDALPNEKSITNQGFNATWQAGNLSQDNQVQLTTCLYDATYCPNAGISYRKLDTAFVTTNDTYTKTDRTIKYALLLIVVSFGTMFLFEVIKGLRIHPIQYGLVASALLVFYVLLLSLAEQVAFGLAYLIASVACVGLVGWYTCYVLATAKRGVMFSAILASLYAVFYVVLSASGLNLLLGSLFCFALIAIAMYTTRHVDWYALGDKAQEKLVDSVKPSKPSQDNANQQGDNHETHV